MGLCYILNHPKPLTKGSGRGVSQHLVENNLFRAKKDTSANTSLGVSDLKPLIASSEGRPLSPPPPKAHSDLFFCSYLLLLGNSHEQPSKGDQAYWTGRNSTPPCSQAAFHDLQPVILTVRGMMNTYTWLVHCDKGSLRETL